MKWVVNQETPEGRIMKKLIIIALVIIAAIFVYRLGVEYQYRQLENEYQMCIMR